MNLLPLATAAVVVAGLAPAQRILPRHQAPPHRFSVARPDSLLTDAVQSWGHDIDDRGRALIAYRADAWKRTKAAVWHNGVILQRILPQPQTPGSTPPTVPDIHRYLRATALNSAGLVVGDALHRSLGELSLGFVSVVPAPVPYPPLHTSGFGLSAWYTNDVSNADPALIVGGGLFPRGFGLNDAFRGYAITVDASGAIMSGTLAEIPSFGGERARSLAHATNADGMVVGWAELPTGYGHAFSWDFTTRAMLDLGTLGGPSSAAFDLNDAGLIVGQADVGPGVHHAALWRAGRAVDLGTLGGATSAARGTNAAGDIVGWSWTGTGRVHAFLWTRGTMWDLNDLWRRERDDWVLQYAEAINARGQIVGWGRHRGETRAFVLTPRD